MFEIQLVDITAINDRDPHRQVKIDDEAFLALRQNISDVGLRYPPELMETDDAELVPVSGYTRIQAFKENRKQMLEGDAYKGKPISLNRKRFEEWCKIPARIVKPVDQTQALEMSAAENLLRNDMNPMDLSDLLKRLKDAYEKERAKESADVKSDSAEVLRRSMNFAEYYSKILGKSKSWIYDVLQLQYLKPNDQAKVRSWELKKEQALDKVRGYQEKQNKPSNEKSSNEKSSKDKKSLNQDKGSSDQSASQVTEGVKEKATSEETEDKKEEVAASNIDNPSKRVDGDNGKGKKEQAGGAINKESETAILVRELERVKKLVSSIIASQSFKAASTREVSCLRLQLLYLHEMLEKLQKAIPEV